MALGHGAWGWLFRVTLCPEPSNFAVARQPFVNCGLVFESGDKSNFDSRTMCLDLPITFSDPLWFEYDSERFAHLTNMPPIPLGR
jgi:hypothetical protein